MSETPSPSARPVAFVLKFLGLLLFFFLVVAPKPVNDAVVVPFTSAIARAGAIVCSLFGEHTTMVGTAIVSPRFSVNIHNGCNGLETMMIFAAAVLAFPAPWRIKLPGLFAGLLVIQLVNMVRIVALFYTGLYLPKVFEKSHEVIWPAAVILTGVGLFVFWADRFALPRQTSAS